MRLPPLAPSTTNGMYDSSYGVAFAPFSTIRPPWPSAGCATDSSKPRSALTAALRLARAGGPIDDAVGELRALADWRDDLLTEHADIMAGAWSSRVDTGDYLLAAARSFGRRRP